VAALELVLEAAINDHTLVIVAAVAAVEDLEECLFRDPGNAIGLPFLEEVG
jgi:hypothetical protein